MFTTLNTQQISSTRIPGTEISKTQTVPNTNRIKTFGQMLHGFAVVFIMLGIAHLLGIFLVIIFISVSSLPILRFLYWLVGEMTVSSVFIFTSIKSYNLPGEISEIQYHTIRLCILSAILLVFALCLGICFSPLELVQDSHKWNDSTSSNEDKAEGIKAILLLSIFCSSLLKLVAVLFSLILCILQKKAIISQILSNNIRV